MPADPARETADLRGPHVPAAGALDGTLYLTSGPDCRLQALDLAQLDLGELGPTTSCRVWVSPDSELAVVRRRSVESRRELWLVRLGNPPELVRKLGLGQSVPTWSPDSSEIAWCGDDRATLVVDLDTGTQRSVPGCFPRFLPDDRLVTRAGSGPEASMYVDGAELLDERDLLDGFFLYHPAVVWAGGLHVLGSGAAPEGDLLVAVRTPGPTGQPTAVLERWQGEELRQAFPIPASYPPAVSFYGFRVEVSPNGSEAAFLFPERLTPVAERLAALVDLRTGTADVGESSFAGLAWSPDGAWLALSTGRELRILGVDRSTPAYVLPLATRGLAWTR